MGLAVARGSIAGFAIRHSNAGQNAWFSAIVVLTLGLGIGARIAIFNVVNGVLLAGLPFREPDRLVALHEKLGNRDTSFSPPDYIVLTQQKDWFSSLGSFRNTDYEISGSGAPERITGAQVTASLFETLGVDAVMGRTFTDAEDNEGREVALLSHAYWKRKFGQDALVIGRGIRVDRRLYTVIGVLPPSFVFPPRGLPFNGKPAEVFVPMSFTAEQKQAYGMFYEARSERPTGSSRGTDKNRLRLTRLEPVWAWNRSRRIHGEKVPAVPGTTQPYSPLRIISRQAFLPPCPQNFFSTRALF